MIENGKLEERNRTSRRSGAQPAVSQVESSVASLQQKQQQQQQQQQQRQQSHKHQQRMAPLASLDCSITEPLSEPTEQVQVHLLNQQQQQQQQRQRRPSPVETPTLSGYFDCDQLSDMVDGSLFEITYAGCLSRTVFAVNGPPATTTHRQPASLAIISRDTSSAGEDNESSDSAERPDSGAKTPTNTDPPPAQQESLEQTAPMKPKSQLELLANYQPYDYSSTSRVPAQTRQASGAAASQVSHLALQQQQQQYSSGASTASGNSHKQRGTRQSGRLSVGVGSSRSQPLSAGAGVKSQRSQQHQHQRKSRSNPDMRDGPAEPAGAGGLCATCREQEAVKKKEKKRFTFSLFNLFTGGASSSSSESNHPLKRDHCQHRRRCAPGTGTGTSGAGGAESRRSKHAPTNHAGSQLKTRDSIRLTNQRKMRNNLMRASNSCAELQRPAEPPELLLDFPAGSGELLLAVADLQQQQQVPIRASQSSNNIQRSRRDSNNSNSNHLHHYYHHHHHGNNLKAAAANATIPINKASQRLTKSVKFTTPDRVLIVPANGRAGEISGSDRAGPNHQLPPADRLPSAPIIKRPVVKASAYAQTEPNKSLYEMLAKYEGNADLIVEINEKLKLTETIASPMSSLDRPTTTTTTDDDDDDNGAPNKLTSHLAHSNENNIEPRHHHQQQTEAPLFLLSPTETRLPIGSTTTVVVEPSLLLSTAEEAHHLKANEHDDINNNNNHYHHHDNGSSINGTNPQEPTVKSAATTYCQPTDRNSSDGSTIQIEEAPEAEEAGFSQNWLHKQRAFV